MALNNAQRQEIQTLLRRKLDEKLVRYSRETRFMPFLVKIMQDARQVAAYSKEYKEAIAEKIDAVARRGETFL